MAMKHPIDEPEPSKSNDLDDMIAQSIKDQKHIVLMIKLCVIAIVSFAISACVIAFWLLNQ